MMMSPKTRLSHLDAAATLAVLGISCWSFGIPNTVAVLVVSSLPLAIYYLCFVLWNEIILTWFD